MTAPPAEVDQVGSQAPGRFTALSNGPSRCSSMSAPLWKTSVVEDGTCSAAARPEFRLRPVQSATRLPDETAL